MKTSRLCSIEGCNKKHVARGYCRKHYNQVHTKEASYKASHKASVQKFYSSPKGKAYRYKWSQTLKGRYSKCKNDAKHNDRAFSLTIEQFETITKQKCTYCNNYSSGKDFCGIDRIDAKEGYVMGNTQSCCELCNRMKSDTSNSEFIIKCHQISDHLRGYK